MAQSYYTKDCYYTRDINQQDHWQGKLCKQLALDENNFDAVQFNNLIFENPKRAGYDLCFSAPKSVSVAMITDDNVRQDMLLAHNAAIEKVLNQIEEYETRARVTRSGVTESILTGNMACARFQHYVSRNSDPQLHDHCVVLNRTKYNSRLYALANEQLYENKILYGQLYRNELARNIQKKGYSVKMTDPEKGFWELQGIEKAVLEHFSTRRKEIIEKLKSWQVTDAESASRATILTRSAKEHRDLALLTQAWRETIKEVGGVKLEKLDEPFRVKMQTKTAAFEKAVERLAEKQYAFIEKDLERAVLAEGCIAGMNREDFRQAFEKSNIIRLGTAKNANDTVYYTTARNVTVELQIENLLHSTKETVTAISSMKVKEDIHAVNIDKKLNLSNEQIAAVMHITTGKDQFLAVQGLAGTGKTYMLNAAREVWERNGYRVTGTAYTGKAAEGLQVEAKIKSTTIHSLLNRLEKEAGNAKTEEDLSTKKTWNFEGLNPANLREVWIVDEAGMIDNNLFLPLQQASIAKRAQVVFIGDYQQLMPIGTGNTYSNLVQSGKISTCYLGDIIRQRKNQELLQAVQEAVRGDINQSLALVADSSQEIRSTAKRFKAITDEYISLSAVDQANTIILTTRNKDRIALNESIRAKLVKSGRLEQGTEIIIQTGKASETTRSFAKEDKILFFKNDYRLGVKNGQAGKIKAIEGKKITVETAGKNLIFDIEEYKHFDYGYAMTTHKAQGATADRVIINLDSSQKELNSRNSYYVDISRARHRVSIYVDNQDKISDQISHFVKKISSHDFTQEPALVAKQKSSGIELPISPVKMLTQALEARTSKIVDMAEEAIKGIQQNLKSKIGMHK